MQWHKQGVHASWLIAAGCIGIVGGIALSRLAGVVGVIFLAAGSGALAISLWRQRLWMVALAISGGLMIGMWRGGMALSALTVYRPLMGKTVSLTGQVNTDPQPTNGGAWAVSLTNILIRNVACAGTINVTLPDNINLRRDDTLTVTGVLAPGYGNYAANMFTPKLVASTRPHNIFLDTRDSFTTAIKQVLAEPMASLGVGFLVGQKSALPNDFSEALKIAGLTHIVVASGYNLTILVRLARRLFEKVSKYQAALWSVVMIVGFMAITGWSASMTRAGLVAALSLWAWYYGRTFHPIVLLSLAASVTALVYPPYAWGDIGWALSFAAFAGVIIFAPLLQAYFYGGEQPHGVAQVVLETIAAQLVTLPIMLSVFGRFSVIALVSNVLVLSLVPLAMLVTFIAGLGQLFLPSIATIIAWPAQAILSYMVWVINQTASFSWAQVTWYMPWWGAALCYMGIIIAGLYLRRVTGYQLRQVNVVE